MPVELTTFITRRQELMTTQVDDDLVILNMSGNNYVALDAIGRRVWELLADTFQVGDLCRLLSREYDATEEQIAADVMPFLAELEKEGLVYVVDEQAG